MAAMGSDWNAVIQQNPSWEDESPSIRAGVASLAAQRICTTLKAVQQQQQPPAHAATSLPEQPECLGHPAHLIDLQRMTEHAAAKLEERLRHETSADVLASLVKLAQAIGDSLVLMLSRLNAGLVPIVAQAALSPAQCSGSALAAPRAVFALAERLLAAADGAGSLKQHRALLGQLARSLCQVAATAHAPAGTQLPGSFSVAAAAGLQKLLACISEALNRPPREIFAGVGGAPEAVAEEMQGAADRWRQDSAALLAVTTELLETLASLGSLQLPQKSTRGAAAEADAEAAEQAASAGSFWSDVRVTAGSSQVLDAPVARASSDRSREAAGEQGSKVTGDATNRNRAEGTGAKTKPLIQELDGDPPTSGGPNGRSQSPSQQEADRVSKGGVIIEEISDDVSGDAADASEAEVPVLTVCELADVLLACAVHGLDQRLDAPWASRETTSAATSVLERLAGHLTAARPSQKDKKGINGHRGTENALASSAVQALIVELLPLATPHLSSTLVETPEQQRQKARMEAYKGPDVFERAVAAQQLAWCIRRVGYRGLGAVVGYALPVIMAAAEDASPAVQNQGFWALHHLATEALPADLLWQKEALLKAARKCLVGCDELAWPAAASAACALAVSLEGRDIFGTGYEWVLGEMLTQGNSYAHVPSRRIAWLQAAQPLLQAMGLASVRHFSRLLPLLLEWLHAPDLDTRLAAAPVLHAVLKHTWPRLPAHAGLLWQHVAQEYTREAQFALKSEASAGQEVPSVGPVSGSGTMNGKDSSGGHGQSSGESNESYATTASEKRQELMAWLQRIAEVLWWAGSEPFREKVRAQQATDASSAALWKDLDRIKR
ncbi:Uncharacterized protein At2g39910 at C-terminar half [Coccomyxa sp. Obi]|nr:Uncharacterized protein At2g39910 at C-terminar half [Coccomyxa sp. Obi]